MITAADKPEMKELSNQKTLWVVLIPTPYLIEPVSGIWIEV